MFCIVTTEHQRLELRVHAATDARRSPRLHRKYQIDTHEFHSMVNVLIDLIANDMRVTFYLCYADR